MGDGDDIQERPVPTGSPLSEGLNGVVAFTVIG